MKEKIYTHDEAMLLCELFEDILIRNNICVPSPEDDERDAEDAVGLYGSTYSELLDDIEERLIELLEKHTPETEIVSGEFSGLI